MPWCRAERAIVGMIRPRADQLEALAPLGLARCVELQFVEAFLREVDGALCPDDLKSQLHLAATGYPTGADGAARAAGETHEEIGLVIDRHLTHFAGAGRYGTPGVHRIQLTAHGLHTACEIA